MDLEEEEEEEEEEEVVSILPSQSVSAVEQGPLAILSQEETIRLAHQSDTTESYGRADVQDSDSETDVASEELGPPLTQPVVDTEDKLQSSLATPTLRPEDIEFPDLLRWVARNSNFDATAPPPKSDEEVLFESEVRPDPRGSDFLQLSPSPAIRALAERRAKEAQEKEKEGLPTIGKVPPSTICRVPMRQYSLSGEEIRKSAPTWAPERPDWISKVKPNTRLYLTDSDAARLDSSARESLVILSNLDAVTSALQHTITDTDALTVPFILRALQFVGGGLADLARLSTCSSHQLSLHRRDAALWEAKSRRISSRQLATLRHAPFLASQYVFDPEVVQDFGGASGGRSEASYHASSHGSSSVTSPADTRSGEEVVVSSIYATVCLEEVPQAGISAEDTGGAGSSDTGGDLLSGAASLQVA